MLRGTDHGIEVPALGKYDPQAAMRHLDSPNNERAPEQARESMMDDERQLRRTRLAGAARILSRQGLEFAANGSISVRDPEIASDFWIFPYDVPWIAARPEDAIRVDARGEVIDGSGTITRQIRALNAEIYRNRPQVMCAIHAHPPHTTAWASLGREIEPITVDACAFWQCHAICSEDLEPRSGSTFDAEKVRGEIAAT